MKFSKLGFFSLAFSLMSFLLAASVQAAPRCRLVLQSLDSKKVDATIEDLAQFIFDLETAKAVNANSLVTRHFIKDYPRKVAEAVSFVEASEVMSKAELFERLRQSVARIQDQKAKEQEAIRTKETRESSVIKKDFYGKTIPFNPVEPGSFKMGVNRVTVHITKRFEMMLAPMSQHMWVTLKAEMGGPEQITNPSNFKDGITSAIVNIKGVNVQMRGENPVENISWNEGRDFIDRLNQLSSHGDAKVQALLTYLMPGHQKGDVYDYPTEAQWEFVRTARGTNYKEFFNREDESELKKHSLYGGQREGIYSTEPVASREPWIIDGKEYYDLQGNVSVWMRGGDEKLTEGAVDPQGSANDFPMIRGGAWYSWPYELGRTYRRGLDINSRNSGTGIRLVRTRQGQ